MHRHERAEQERTLPMRVGREVQEVLSPEGRSGSRRRPAPRVVSHRGRLLTVSASPSAESHDLAADHFERKESGEGFAAQLMRFSQPLIEAARDNPVAVQNAMTLGALLWNVAVAGEDVDTALAHVMRGMSLSDDDAADFRSIAAGMVERHRQMFPALHAGRRERCASTGG